jgi:hypothetical protein
MRKSKWQVPCLPELLSVVVSKWVARTGEEEHRKVKAVAQEPLQRPRAVLIARSQEAQQDIEIAF